MGWGTRACTHLLCEEGIYWRGVETWILARRRNNGRLRADSAFPNFTHISSMQHEHDSATPPRPGSSRKRPAGPQHTRGSSAALNGPHKHVHTHQPTSRLLPRSNMVRCSALPAALVALGSSSCTAFVTPLVTRVPVAPSTTSMSLKGPAGRSSSPINKAASVVGKVSNICRRCCCCCCRRRRYDAMLLGA